MKNLTKTEKNSISGDGNIHLSCDAKAKFFGIEMTQKIDKEFTNIQELEKFMRNTKRRHPETKMSCNVNFNSVPYSSEFPNVVMNGPMQIDGSL